MFLYESPEVLVSDGGFLVQPGVKPGGVSDFQFIQQPAPDNG